MGVMLPRSSGEQAGFWMQENKDSSTEEKEDLLHRGEGKRPFL